MVGASGVKAAMANFDCDDIYREHAFLVRLTKGREPTALVFEVFGRPPSEVYPSAASPAAWAPETVLRCEVPRAVWDAAAPEARAEFNRRLRIVGKPAGRWGADDTAVQRLFGKELLLVLLWAIERSDVSPEEIAVGIRNWLGLKPEERWWLYTMTAAATGLAHQVGIGWRDALRRALCFGTRRDAFHLGAVAARGSLEPHVLAQEAAKPKRPIRKKSKVRHEDGLLFPKHDPAAA
jgi:Protein of unknown function (DUF3780)